MSGWENRGPAPALAGSRGLVKKIPGPERPAGGCLPLFGKGADQAGAPTEAIAAYERSLKLTLAGHKPLKAPILSNPEAHPLLDPDHFRVHTLLARLYEREGETDTAIMGYRMGIGLGGDGFWPHYRLACLYFRQRRWQESCTKIWQALKKLPKDVWQTLARCYYRVKLALQNRFGATFTP